MTQHPAAPRRSGGFLLAYALANAGGVLAYLPFLTLLLPLKVEALAGQGRVMALSVILIGGAAAASVGNILAGLLIDRLVAARPVDLYLPWPNDPRALALAERLLRPPTERREIAALAEAAGASLRTLQRLFLMETGLTIEAWRQKARLVHAASLLSLGASVTTTAADCGYDSLSAFIVAFQRQFGVTPGRYRPARL